MGAEGGAQAIEGQKGSAIRRVRKASARIRSYAEPVVLTDEFLDDLEASLRAEGVAEEDLLSAAAEILVAAIREGVAS